MHNNYYFLRKLTKNLEAILKGAVISECFSQNKEELILRLEITQRSFFIRASLVPEFTCLSFPENFNRARRNSVDLFSEIIGLRVSSIRQYRNERSFALELSENNKLLFKMHGNRSNIILFSGDDAVSLFRKNIPGDFNIKPDTLDRNIDWSYEHFISHADKIKNTYFTFGKLIWDHLDTLNFNAMSVQEKWDIIRHITDQLEDPVFYITELKKIVHLSLIKTGNVTESHRDPIQALNIFNHKYTQTTALTREKATLIQSLHTRLTSSHNYHKKTSEKLTSLGEDNPYKLWADLIMANMHHIKQGQERVALENFYNENSPIEVRLKKELSPQKNAELYYRKAKNQDIERKYLENALIAKQREIEHLQSLRNELEQVDDLKMLRSKAAAIAGDISNGKSEKPLPYHEFMHGGFRILVGRNASANDELTQKYTYKEDLWLHVKDTAGSHVVIKYQAGKKFPKDVIEKAAQLAAWNSKRKNESLCPVIVTPKKYVRKRKGDPPGAVIVEREDVILVTPAAIDR